MASKKFERDSSEFKMFTDFWQLSQKYWVMEDTTEYWESLTKDCDTFAKKYKTDFAGRLATALCDSKNHDWKEGRDAEKKERKVQP